MEEENCDEDLPKLWNENFHDRFHLDGDVHRQWCVIVQAKLPVVHLEGEGDEEGEKKKIKFVCVCVNIRIINLPCSTI